MKYFVNVYQPEPFPMVEIEIRTKDDLAAGYISARCQVDFIEGDLRTSVMRNVSISAPLTPDEALEISDWWRVAASTAKSLGDMIKTPNDLNRPISAKVVNGSVLCDFDDMLSQEMSEGYRRN